MAFLASWPRARAAIAVLRRLPLVALVGELEEYQRATIREAKEERGLLFARQLHALFARPSLDRPVTPDLKDVAHKYVKVEPSPTSLLTLDLNHDL
jgi:hypothetical protein